MAFPPIPSTQQVRSFTSEGSPLLLRAAGRVFGMGQAEQQALMTGQIPWWVPTLAALAVGVVVGSRVQRKYPKALPALVSGR